MSSIQDRLEILQRLAACFVNYPIHSLSDLADGQLFHYILYELGNEQEVSCLSQTATYAKIKQHLQVQFTKENLVDVKALQDGNLEEVAKLFAITLYLSACVFKNEEVQKRMERGLEDDPMAGIYVMQMLQQLQDKHTSLTSSELRDIVLGHSSVSSGGASPVVYGFSPHPSPARSLGAGAMSPATPKITSMQATLRKKTQEIRELNQQITAEQNEKFALAENVRSCQKRIDELEKTVASLRKENQDLIVQMNKSPSPTPGDAQMSWEARKHRKDLEELEKAQVEILGLKTENEALKQNKENLQTKLQSLEAKLRKSSEHVCTLEAQYATLEMELTVSTQRAHEFEGLYNEKLSVVLALQERMRECEDNHMSFALSPRQPEESLGFQLLSDQLEAEKKKFEDTNAKYESQIASLQSGLQEKEDLLIVMEEKVTVLQRELSTQLESFRALELVKTTCQNDLAALQLEKMQLLESQRQLLATHKDFAEKLKESDKRLQVLDAESKNLLALKEDLETRVQQITQESSQTVCQLKESHKSEVAVFHSQLAALNQEKCSLQEILHSKEARESELNDAVQQLERKYCVLEQQSSADLAAKELDLCSKMENLSECQQKINALSLQLENAQSSHQTLQSDRDDLKNQVESASLRYETLLKEKEDLLVTEQRLFNDLRVSVENGQALQEKNMMLNTAQQDLQRQMAQIIADFEGKISELTKAQHLEATQFAEEKTKLEKAVCIKQAEETRLKSELSELEGKYGQLDQTLTATKGELEQKDHQLAKNALTAETLRQELERSKLDYDKMESQKKDLEEELQNILLEKQGLLEDKAQFASAVEELRSDLAILREGKEHLQSQRNGLVAKEAELESQVATLVQEAEQLRTSNEIQTLELQNAIKRLNSEKEEVVDTLRAREREALERVKAMAELAQERSQVEQDLKNALMAKDEEVRQKSEKLAQTEQLADTLNQELTVLRSTYETCDTQRAQLQTQIENLNEEKKTFIDEKEQLLAKLEELNEELGGVQDDLKAKIAENVAAMATSTEWEERLAILTRDSEKKVQELTKLKDSEALRYQTQISQLTSENSVLNDTLRMKEARESQLTEELYTTERKIKETQNILASKEEEVARKSEILAQTENQNAVLLQELETLRSTYATAQTNNTGYLVQIEALRKDKENLCKEKEQILEDLERKAQKLQEMQATVTSLEAGMSALRSERQSAEGDALTQISALQQEKETLLEQLDNLRVEVEVSREDLANLRAENVRLESELGQAAASWEEAKEKVIEKLRETEQNVDALTNANNQLQKTCNQQKEELEHCQARITTTSATVENLQSQLKILNAERQEMKIKVSQLTKNIEETEAAKQVVKSTLEALQCEYATMKTDWRILSGETNNYKESMASYEAQINALEERNAHLAAESQKEVSAVKARLEEVQKEHSKLKACFEVQEAQRQQLNQQLTAVTCQKEELRRSAEELRGELTKAVDDKLNVTKMVDQLKAERSVWQGTQSTTVQEHLQVIEKLQEQNEQLSRDCIKAKAEVVELLQFKKDAQLKRQQEEEQSEDKKKLSELMQKVEKLTNQNLDLLNKFQEAEKCASEAMDRAAKALEQHKKDWTAKREKMLEEMLAKQDLQEQERKQLENDFDTISGKYQLAKEKLAQQETLEQRCAELEERYRQSRAAQTMLEAENRTLRVAESHLLAKIGTEKDRLEAKHQKQVQALKASSNSLEEEASVEDFMPSRRQTMTVRSLRPSVSESSATFVKDGFKVPAPAKSCTVTSQFHEEGGLTNRRDSVTSIGSIAELSSSKETFVAAANATFIACPIEESSSVNRRQSTSSLCSITSTSSQRSVPQGAGKYFSCDDEAGEVFSSSYLSELKSGVCKVEDPLARMSELERRNTLCLPHMRSAYPTEFNDEKLRRLDVPAFPRLSLASVKSGVSNADPVSTITEGTAALSVVTPPAHNTRGRKRRSFELDNADLTFSARDSLSGSFTQSLSDSVTSQSSQGSVDRKRRKEVIMTSYHKPGPPTPAKSTSAVRERVPRAEVLSPNDTPKVSSKGKSLKPKTRTPLKSRNSGVGVSSASKKTPSSLVKRVQDKLKQNKAANDENTPRTRSKLNIFRKPFGSRSYASDI